MAEKSVTLCFCPRESCWNWLPFRERAVRRNLNSCRLYAQRHARVRAPPPSPRCKFACRAGKFSVLMCQGLFSSSNYKCFKYASHAHSQTHMLTFIQPGRYVSNSCFHTLSSVKYRAARGFGFIRSSFGRLRKDRYRCRCRR